jgi:hypothetical protein
MKQLKFHLKENRTEEGKKNPERGFFREVK